MTISLGWYVPTKKGYTGRQRSRWVLAVNDGRVLYGRGGMTHFECKCATFEKWIRRTAAVFNPRVVASNRPASAQVEIA